MNLSPEATEARREYNRQYRLRNAEKIREYTREWRQKNADHVREYNQKYQAAYWERKAVEMRQVQNG